MSKIHSYETDRPMGTFYIKNRSFTFDLSSGSPTILFEKNLEKAKTFLLYLFRITANIEEDKHRM